VPAPLDASVIVNTYRQPRSLTLTLASLTAQDHHGVWEIIVSDDGSGDDTAALVTGFAQTTLVPITYVAQAHRGNRWAAARNRGTALARGDVLIFLDADMVPARDVVRRHVDAQRAQPALIAGNRLWLNPSKDLADADSPEEHLTHLHHLTESADPEQIRREEREQHWREQLIAGSSPWRAWFGCHTSVPRSPQILFDEAMTGWGPVDVELALRLTHHHGLTVRYQPEITAWHLDYDEGAHNPFRRTDSDADTGAATAYVLQTCRMIAKYPDLDLLDDLSTGFDRLTLQPDGTWRTVPRGHGGDARTTLHQAIAWHTQRP
jgi:glycosyltransferase involved in cell wall biosynthesis